jgi:hypothetical protein
MGIGRRTPVARSKRTPPDADRPTFDAEATSDFIQMSDDVPDDAMNADA